MAARFLVQFGTQVCGESSGGYGVVRQPMLRAMRSRFPDARISYLLRRYLKPIYAGMPWADRLLTFRPDEGVPALYYATGLDWSGESFEERDYALIRDAWGTYRRRLAAGRLPGRG